MVSIARGKEFHKKFCDKMCFLKNSAQKLKFSEWKKLAIYLSYIYYEERRFVSKGSTLCTLFLKRLKTFFNRK